MAGLDFAGVFSVIKGRDSYCKNYVSTHLYGTINMTVWVNGKFVHVNAMKAYTESGGVAPLILTSTLNECEINLIPWPLHPR
jgi:hypothetical protein